MTTTPHLAHPAPAGREGERAGGPGRPGSFRSRWFSIAGADILVFLLVLTIALITSIVPVALGIGLYELLTG